MEINKITKTDAFAEFDRVIKWVTRKPYPWEDQNKTYLKFTYRKFDSLLYMLHKYKLLLNNIPEDDFIVLLGGTYENFSQLLARVDYSDELIDKYINFLDNFDIDEDEMFVGYMRFKYLMYKRIHPLPYDTCFMIYRVSQIYLDMHDHYDSVFTNRRLRNGTY